MKKILTIVLALVLSLSFAACGSSGANGDQSSGNSAESDVSGNDYPEMHLRLSSEWVPGYPFESEVLEPLQAKLDDLTGGKLIIDYFPGNTLTTSAEALGAVAEGVVDIAIFPTAYVVGELPVTFLVEYPQKFNSSKAASFAMRDWLRELAPAEYERAGVSVLMCTTMGDAIIAHNADRSITAMSDFQGLQIRGNAVMIEAINAWGGTGVTVAMPDTYEALRSGIINGSIAGADAISSFKWTEITKHATRLTVFNASFLMIIGDNTLAKLPSEWQTYLKDACDEVFEESGCNFAERHGDATYEDYAARGIDVDFFDPDELDKLAAAAAPLLENYAADLDSKGLDGAGALALLREKADYYNNLYPDSENPYFAR
ncbi:MAG: TRAP transporter substrate-binding protein DctP [Clostridiales Family XIII bacterium]|jgi:TRAP-type C4-dicarboxylate transport system substrate-binding protein|nr:TRAP transporter substrate-binding protein DctP [Clostridiales Family XIII bacterium]